MGALPAGVARAQEPAAPAAQSTLPSWVPDWIAMGFGEEPQAEPQPPEPEPYFLNSTPSVPGGSQAQGMTTRVSRTVNKDGSSAVTAAGAVREWRGAEFGVDMALAARQGNAVPVQSAVTASQDGAGAAAWARAQIPGVANLTGWDKGSVDVRVDPVQEQGRLGTTFSREFAVTEGVKARVSDSYTVVSGSDGTQQWETGKSVSVDLQATGTSVSVGTGNRSGDASWQPSVSASQQIVGPLSVTTSVADNGDTLNKSITAGFRRTW
ncbi:hypothetical protein [Aquabacter cavernae]|uniref:hypothetical protein n=1 Tax=Aquabacter cavernae TaxID=2496029 RepID=UPI000F8D3162|nr:hypothetical protein [Aquabacter cavernae]